MTAGALDDEIATAALAVTAPAEVGGCGECSGLTPYRGGLKLSVLFETPIPDWRCELRVPVSVDERCLRLNADDGSDGTLLGMRCVECGIVVFGPATFCQSCSSPRLEQIDLATDGILYSYTIVRVPPPGWPGPVPYALGEVELPEGPHVLAEVIDCAHDELRVGMPMTLALRAVAMPEVPDSERMVYKWRPA